jgi:hypothetical protein
MAERCIGCDGDLLHKFFMCVGRMVTCSNGLGKSGVEAQVDCIFCGALQVPSRDFWDESPRSSLHCLYLIEALLKALCQTFCRVKTHIFDWATITHVHFFLLEDVLS